MKSGWMDQRRLAIFLFGVLCRCVGKLVGICHSCHEDSFHLGNSGDRLRQIMDGEQICFCSRAAPTSVDGWYARHEMVLSSGERCYSRGNGCLFVVRFFKVRIVTLNDVYGAKQSRDLHSLLVPPLTAPSLRSMYLYNTYPLNPFTHL